ncbi:TRAP transporter permease [Falsiroseomonas sp. HW251]|uniref:TRAP transporter permease n=1 Tax=Falsiroseomonas sp. HW251 TaxID=3390998 RepID=UPI003D322536
MTQAGRDEHPQLTAEELEQLSADSDGGPAYRPDGMLGRLTAFTAFGISAYSLVWTQFSLNTTFYRSSFLAICLALGFLVYPLVRNAPRRRPGATEYGVALIGLGGLAWMAMTWPPVLAGGYAGGVALACAAWLMLYPVAVATPFFQQTRALDWLAATLAIWTCIYLVVNADALRTRATVPSADDLALGGALMLLVLEAARRATGWVLPAITIGFLAYCYFGPWIPEPFDHRGFSVARIIGQNYLTLEGIFSTPVDVAATFIILFTIYGAVLERGGAGRFFIDWSFALFGRRPSAAAPGRAVMASGFLLGTVSGSGIATTVTLASLAWPMLKRAGYTPAVGGGMLAASGIGAVLSPPTLGAAAFIIAEYLNVEYLAILAYAAIPTVLYYLGCWLTTEADARRLGVHATRISDALPWQLAKREGYHFASLAAVAVLLVLGMSSFMAVFWSIVVAIVLSMIRPESRLLTREGFGVAVTVMLALLLLGPLVMDEEDARFSVYVFLGLSTGLALSGFQALRATRRGRPMPDGATGLIEALTEGARSTIGIVATCACAGIIVSTVSLTGLGLTLSSILVDLGQGSRLGTLLLAALAMWVLGLAVPVTASYIIGAVMLVPALSKVGVPEAAGHMFIFYYSVLADVSPPTALAPFAASAITRGSPLQTTMQAWKYTLPAFLVPFMFCLSPEGLQLLMLTPGGAFPDTVAGWGGIALAAAKACLALVGLCAGLTGYLLIRASVAERLIAGFGGIVLLVAGWETMLVGLALLVVALALQLRRRRVAPSEAPA